MMSSLPTLGQITVLEKIAAWTGVQPLVLSGREFVVRPRTVLLVALSAVVRMGGMGAALLDVTRTSDPWDVAIEVGVMYMVPQVVLAAQIYEFLRSRALMSRYLQTLAIVEGKGMGVEGKAGVGRAGLLAVYLCLAACSPHRGSSPIKDLYFHLMQLQTLGLLLLLTAYLDDLSSRLSSLTARASGRADELELLSWAHATLSRGGELLGDAFSLRTLLLLTQFFLQIIIYAFSAHAALPLRGKRPPASLNPFFIFGMLTYLFYLLCILVESFNEVTEKAKQFSSVLYRQMISDTSEEVIQHRKLGLHIIMRKEVVFTACGLFNLDKTLILTVVASTASYLVIVLQFTDPEA